MMFCEHGLTRETCPYCIQQTRIKPPTQLVHPAPTELPMNLPVVNDFNKHKTQPENELFKVNSPITNIPLTLSRKLNLNQDFFSSNSTIFHKDLQKLQERQGYSKESKEINPNVNIFDLKKKFTKITD